MQEETDMEQKNEQSALILVVDDEPDIRRIIRILLESGGYRVAEAQNGLAAVEYVRKQPGVDLVLMDIMMPGLDGVSASREIRECCAAPILFLTAKTQEQDKLEAYQAGGDDYLAKPFSHAELMMKVESLLRRYRVYKGKTNGQVLRADVVLDEPGRRVLRGGRSVELTETEFEILCFLERRVGRADLSWRLARKIHALVHKHSHGTYCESAQEAGGGSDQSPPHPHGLGEGVSD